MNNSAVDIDLDKLVERSRQGTSIGWPLAFTALILFLPSATYYLLGTSSDTPGLAVVCLLLWVASLASGSFTRRSHARHALGAALAIVIFLIAHLCIAVFLPYIPQSVDIARTSVSVVAFIGMMVGAGVAADWQTKASTVEIDRIGSIVRIVLVMIGLWSFVGWQPPSPLDLSRPSFPFSEPSHYALVAAPFIIDGCVGATKVRRLFWLVLWLTIGLLDKSLSLLVIVVIAAAVSLPILYAALAAVPVGVIAAGMDLKYYTDRLDFSATSTNLSALIYRQGWELMQQGLVYSGGWGVGFQQLGFAPLNSPTSDIVYKILGSDSNLRDGSFLAAKLVSEFGLFGIAILALYITIMIGAAIRLRRLASHPALLQDSNLRFVLAMICAFSTEMFVRDIGYFSSTVLVFLASLMAMRRLVQNADG